MNAPRSLRRLFETDDGPQPNSFKFPLKAPTAEEKPSGLATGPRSGSFGQGSIPHSSSSSNGSVSTPTAFSFGASITGNGATNEVNTIRLPALDDDSDEEDSLPSQGGSRYGSFMNSVRDETASDMAGASGNMSNRTLGANAGKAAAGERKSHNLAQIVIPGMEDTVKFGGGDAIQIDSEPSPDANSDYKDHGYDTGSTSGFGSASGSGFNSGYGFNSRWNASGHSSPTTIKFQPDRNTDHGIVFQETGYAPSPLTSSRPGMRRAETENPADMQRRPHAEHATVEPTISEAPDYAPNEAFSFPSRPSSPFSQHQNKASSARLFHSPQTNASQRSLRQYSGDMPVLPSEPVRIETAKPPSMPLLPRIHSAFSTTNAGKMSEPLIRIAPMMEPGTRPGMPRQASVAVMDGASTMTPLSGIPMSNLNQRSQATQSHETRHHHRGSKASLGSGDSGRSYSLANNPNHAYPMPLSGQSSSGSASMSRDRSQSAAGMESDVSSVVGDEVPPLSTTLDLREALKVIFISYCRFHLGLTSPIFCSHRGPSLTRAISCRLHLWDPHPQPSDILLPCPRPLPRCRPLVPVRWPFCRRPIPCAAFRHRRRSPTAAVDTPPAITANR